MLDSLSESIAHFVGQFHLATEEARLRKGYDEFQHAKAKRDDPEAAEAAPAETPGYELDPYEPGLDWRPTPDGPRDLPPPTAGAFDPQPPAPAPTTIDAYLPAAEGGLGPAAAAGPLPVLPPPSSLVTFTAQSIHLADDDSMGDVAHMAAPEGFAGRLDRLMEAAQGLRALGPLDPSGPTPWVGTTATLRAEIAAAAGAEAPAGTLTLTGAEATGTWVDGAAAEEMPALTDHLPAFLKAKLPPPEAEEGAEPDGDGDGEPGAAPEAGPPEDALGDLPRDPGPDGTPEPLPGGHLLVAGANVAVNEASLVTAWIDARVIAVKGDVTRIDAMSQVNVLSDHDDLGAGGGAGGAPALPSTLLNAARIDGEAAPAVTGDIDATPAGWVVTRIDGDLVSFNWVRQTTFVTDHDRAVVTTTGSSTSIVLGGNEAVNALSLAALGFQYDLILVGGSLYDVSAIAQVNVLLDDDRVSGAATGGGGDNLLFNSASIMAIGVDGYRPLSGAFEDAIDDLADGTEPLSAALAQDALLQGLGLLRVLHVSGDLVLMNLIEQVNVVGDADQVEVALAAAALDPHAEVEVVAGSNALANLATIREVGVDSVVLAGGALYTDALIHQAGFLSPDAGPTGIAPQGLANEAVLFLADGMIEPEAMVADGGLAPPPAEPGGLDVMQSMLA